MEGIRVVELGVWVAGPAAGGILADWGADVIKIEPPTGDPARMFGRMLGLDGDQSPPFEMDNRGKRSVVLDLTTEDGRTTALECPSRRTEARRPGLRDRRRAQSSSGLWLDHWIRRLGAGRRPRRL